MAARREITKGVCACLPVGVEEGPGSVVGCAARGNRAVEGERPPRRGQCRQPAGPSGGGRTQASIADHGYDTFKVPIEVRNLLGEQCGKCLGVIIAESLTQLETFEEVDKVTNRLNEAVRDQWVAISPALIDRLLGPTKAAPYPSAKSRPGPGRHYGHLLRCARRWTRGRRHPGFFEIGSGCALRAHPGR